MPLYECSRCGCVDNTAIGGYHEQKFDHHDLQEPRPEFRPLCSECFTGMWHGEFEKKNAKQAGYVPDPKMKGYIMPKGGWK